MSLPSIEIQPQDYGLSAVPSSAAKTVASVGACSAGTPLEVATWNGPNLKALEDELGVGPLVDSVARNLIDSGGPHITVPVTKSVAGTMSAVTPVGTGTSVLTDDTSTPYDAYDVIVKITRASTGILVGGGAFVFSLDGGATWSREVAVPTAGDYTFPATGINVNFAEGTLVVDDTYSFTTTAPAGAVGDITDAIQALIDDTSIAFGCVHVVGAPAPSLSAVTESNPAGPDITLTGTPSGFIDGKVLITLGGTLGTAKFKVSTDGGVTLGAEQTTSAGTPTYLIPGTGVTLNFAAGTYVVTNYYTFNSYGSIGTLFAAVDSLMSAAEAAYKFAFAVLELPDATDAILKKATASLSSTRVMFAGGYCSLASSSPPGRVNSRPDAWPIVSRIAGSEIHEDLGRVRSGTVKGVSAIARDEYVTPGFGTARIESLRTIPGAIGFYIASDTTGGMMAPVASDYAMVQNRRVMDRACVVALAAVTPFLNDEILLNPRTGCILETEAQKIEAQITGLLRADLINGAKRHASGVVATVKRDEVILTTKNLTVDVAIVPLGTAKTITTTLHFAVALE